jgi:hypothetical protein
MIHQLFSLGHFAQYFGPNVFEIKVAQPIHQPGRCAIKPRSAGYVRRWAS